MCQHVLCLSLSTPPLSLLSPNKLAFTHFLPLLIPLFHCVLCEKKKNPYIFGSQETVSLSYIVLPFLSEFNFPPENLLSSSMKPRMYSSSALLKQEFFKKWIKGLQIYSSLNKEMTVLERKKAIKLSADVAIASTRNAATQWSRALVADVSTSAAAADRTVVERILGRELVERKAAAIACSKKIVRRSRLAQRRRRTKAAARVVPSATSVAEKMVRNRTRVLKRLVPGGEKLDEISLIKETLDYIASLRVQVDVMRDLAASAERLDHHQQMSY